ncbi:TPA: hypothetical protein LTW56_003868 [Enterobacter cloacae]|jgi:hypothetical protein|nr:hypothetical protein [Enterobacter sp. UCD-UG_FMILLET]KGI61793.1 hypothetical protein LA04_22015 [Enterobacter sp. UCD-UG_FMILLET]HBL8879080.1 hypothetical protein [Enterobacter cloacae]
MQDSPVIKLRDARSSCWSIMATVSAKDYLELVEASYANDGGLDGQRPAIKSKTGLKIRNRLVRDIKDGAVIPPVVIGVVCTRSDYDLLSEINNSNELISEIKNRNLEVSIIDGMQRTTALKEANAQDSLVRVEIWISEKVDTLIYRMLVLNTGQVPWDLKRQLDVLYKQLITKVNESVGSIRIITVGDNSRRTQAGTYKSSRVVELFLAFTSRSIDVDIKDKMAEEFSKIDITDAASDADYFPLFLDAIRLLVNLDEKFDKVTRTDIDAEEEPRIKSGRDIFTSAPGSIGFIVAVAEYTLGYSGFDYDLNDAKNKMEDLKARMDKLIAYMDSLNSIQLNEFVDIQTLNEVLSTRTRTSRIGELERGYYLKAFTTLFKHVEAVIENNSMYPCWRVI